MRQEITQTVCYWSLFIEFYSKEVLATISFHGYFLAVKLGRDALLWYRGLTLL